MGARRTRTLTIFEGADATGKTTAARAYADATDARYRHCGAFDGVKNIARLYVEAMLPAVLGLADVVLDRSWLSERPYGRWMRENRYRITAAGSRMLDRVAARAATTVVHCDVASDVMLNHLEATRDRQYVQDHQRALAIQGEYKRLPDRTALPIVPYDWTRHDAPRVVLDGNEDRTVPHHVDFTAGYWDAPVLLVGETFGTRRECDAYHRWPFVAYDSGSGGCEPWLTDRIWECGIGERHLLWANADAPIEHLNLTGLRSDRVGLVNTKRVVALGDVAAKRLAELGIDGDHVPHPAYWRRFHGRHRYQLLDVLAESTP